MAEEIRPCAEVIIEGVAPDKVELQTARPDLSRYFIGPYLEGELYSGDQYLLSRCGELETYRFDAADGPVHVWRYAVDLRRFYQGDDKEELVVLYHYTNETRFRSAARLERPPAELFAALEDRRGPFGPGVYASRREAAAWGLRLHILLNGYGRAGPVRADIEVEDAKRVVEEWGDANPRHMDKRHPEHRAAFCIPLLVPRPLACRRFAQRTPGLACGPPSPRAFQLGGSRNKDIWVVRIAQLEQAGTPKSRVDDITDLLRKRLARLRELRGDMHEETLGCMSVLAKRLQDRGHLDWDEAERLHRECLEGRRHTLGDTHPDTFLGIGNLAGLLQREGRFDEAELLCCEVLEGRRQRFGDMHPDTLASINDLAVLLQARGRLAQAEPLCRDALECRRYQLGDTHLDTLQSMSSLAALLEARGKLEEAEPLLREALEGRRQRLGEEHPQTQDCRERLGRLLQGLARRSEGRLCPARRWCRRAARGLRRAEDTAAEWLASCSRRLSSSRGSTVVSF